MKTNMELAKLIVLTCLVVLVDCSKNSRLEQRLNALDNLFQGKIFLVDEQLAMGKQEREKLKTKLNETLEYLETMGSADGKTVMDTNTEGRERDLDVLTDKIDELSNTVEQSDRETWELSETVSRIKRGFQQEKIARKTDTQAVIDQLLEMQKSLFIKMNDIITTQGDLTNKVNNLSETLETALDSHKVEVLESNEIIQTQLTEVKSTTQNLESSISAVASQIQKVIGNVAPKLYCNNRLGLDDCLEKHFAKQQHLMDVIKNVVMPVWLVGGSTKYEGRVEVNFHGRRGTVCDDYWDYRDARVVCRMLGYSDGTALLGPGVTGGHSFGEGTGEVLLDEVQCSGREQSLFDCGHNGLGDADCNHDEDAGVICTP